jgi:hypothetical protein
LVAAGNETRELQSMFHRFYYESQRTKMRQVITQNMSSTSESLRRFGTNIVVNMTNVIERSQGAIS